MGDMHAQIYQALLDVEIATLVAIEIEGTKHKLLSIAVEIPVSATHSAFLVIEDADLICELNLFAVARTDFTNRKNSRLIQLKVLIRGAPNRPEKVMSLSKK